MNFEFGSATKRSIPPGVKFVNLDELSLSGSLTSSVPTKLAVKFDPPTLTIVYHFEQAADLYYHEVPLEKTYI